MDCTCNSFLKQIGCTTQRSVYVHLSLGTIWYSMAGEDMRCCPMLPEHDICKCGEDNTRWVCQRTDGNTDKTSRTSAGAHAKAHA